MKGGPKPFLKWPGGKRNILPQITKFLPQEFGTYFEPFVGGGAMFFELANKKLLRGGSVLGELNESLCTTYRTIRDTPEDLIGILRSLKTDKDSFYYVRDEMKCETPVETSARLIYLNKTCFNGLYRVNKKGLFNVPYGYRDNPNICDAENILRCSEILKGCQIRCVDFAECVKDATRGDLVYLDPPYLGTFCSYTSEGFPLLKQEHAAQTFETLAEKGVYVLMSNSATQWLKDRLKRYNFETIKGRRRISCDSASRGVVDELLVYANVGDQK